MRGPVNYYLGLVMIDSFAEIPLARRLPRTGAVVLALGALLAGGCSETHVAPLAPAAPAAVDERPSDLDVVELGSHDAASSWRLAHEPSPDCDRLSRIEVWKGYRALVAHCALGGGTAMSVAIGREDDGPKRQGRDNRTPEGYYHIAGPARPSRRFHLFIPIDYPSRADAELGLALGTIDESTYASIVEALEEGRLPPQDTPLGGHVGLHGEGERWKGDSISINWTYGCIALADDQIEFLAERAPEGTPIIIHP